MIYKSITICALAWFSLISCAHQQPVNIHLDESWQAPNKNEYYAAVRKQTQRKQKYSGFYNQFDMSLTYLTENILIKQLKMEANYAQWSAPKSNKKLESLEESISHESKFFVSIFTPKSDDSKLDMASSGWVAMLYFDGERFDGHIKAIAKDANSLKIYYPDHNIWSRGFILSFPVPTKELMGKSFQVKFSSANGEAVYKF